MSMPELIHQINMSDLEREEALFKSEKEKRRLLRLAADANSLTTSDLYAQIAGVTESDKPDTVLSVANEEQIRGAQITRESAFPAPPKGPVSGA